MTFGPVPPGRSGEVGPKVVVNNGSILPDAGACRALTKLALHLHVDLFQVVCRGPGTGHRNNLQLFYLTNPDQREATDVCYDPADFFV